MFNRVDGNVQSWRQALNSYRDIRLLYIFLLGCSSGFPWVLVGSSMSGWLSDSGLSRSAIGYFGSVTVVYAINFYGRLCWTALNCPSSVSALGNGAAGLC